MNTLAKLGVLLPLVARLKDCPSRDTRITEKRVVEMWGCFKTINLEHGDTVTPAVLVGLILYNPETFAPLLSRAEHAQLQALGKVALDRYLQQTNPPNNLGKTICTITLRNLDLI